MRNFVVKVFMTIVACIFCMQSVLAADSWIYPWWKPDGKFGGGDGTASAPYLITSAQQLADLAYLVNDGNTYKGKYFKLATDITLNDSTRLGNEWKPIGDIRTFSVDYFSGYFDGGGHAIKGLYLEIGSQKSTGLFGDLKNAVVKNLNIDYCHLQGEADGNYGGILAGYATGTQIVNCHVKNNSEIRVISSDGGYKTAYIGGIVGQAEEGGSIMECSFNGNIYTSYRVGFLGIGGIAGASAGFTLKNCRTDGSFTVRIQALKSLYTSQEIYINGISGSADVMTGCLNNLDFVIHDAGTNDTDRIGLYLYTMGSKVNKMSRSANLGKIMVKGVSCYYGTLGNVNTPKEIVDCAFYTVVEGSFEKWETGGNLTYMPLGQSKGKFAGQWRTVMLDKSYFNSPNINSLKRDDLYKDADFDKRYAYETNAATLSDNDDIFNNLNSASRTAVWGRISDKNSTFYHCPLPLAAGGEYDNDKLSGEGTEADPYLIGSWKELDFLAKGVSNGTISTRGKFFALTTDISQYSVDETIGNESNPFSGTFDGRGHMLNELMLEKGSLFGYVDGTVKNLAVTDPYFRSNKNGYGTIVGQLLSEGTLTDCYVGGTMNVYFNGNSSTTPVGALCAIAKGTISNCYFKGTIKADGIKVTGDIRFGGIVGKNVFCKVNDCYASFSVDATDSFKKSVYGISGWCEGQKSYVTNCYSVCDDAQDAEDPQQEYAKNGKRCNSDSEVLADYDFTATSAWVKGVFRPILRNARHYEATAADGSDDVAYFDAIPLRDDKNPTNDIYHYTATTDDKNDPQLWSLPNLAVYDARRKTEYILNCTLVPDKPLGYTPKKSCVAEYVDVNMHYPLKIVKDEFNTETETAQHYYMLCLPGEVGWGDLPSGCRLLVCGDLQDGENGKTLSASDDAVVPAGMPFIMYLPNAEIGQTVDIVIRSQMALEPKTKITVDGEERELGLQGTFTGGESAVGQYYAVEGTDETTLTNANSKTTLAPFSANVVDNSGSVKLVDYLVLDEMSNETDRVLSKYWATSSLDKVLLKRTLHANAWNTICLPFEMSEAEIAEVFGEGTKLERLSSVNVTDDGGCTLSFTAKDSYINHGVCYLIKPTKDVEFPMLSRRRIWNSWSDDEFNVTIDGTPAVAKFCGTYGRKMLGEGDEDEYFTQDNTIYHVADGQQIVMNGFRCYITANKTAAAAMAKARMVHGDGSTTDLRLVEVGSTADGKQRIYNLQGIEQNSDPQQRGVYIKGGRKYVK